MLPLAGGLRIALMFRRRLGRASLADALQQSHARPTYDICNAFEIRLTCGAGKASTFLSPNRHSATASFAATGGELARATPVYGYRESCATGQRLRRL